MNTLGPKVLLKAGTRVKHGTVASALRSILESGLQPGYSRHALRSLTEESPAAEAVYVGGLSAYFGAWAAASALTKEYELKEPLFKLIAEANSIDLLKTGNYLNPPLAIPVVLEIELAEDTELLGDEDYAIWIKGSDGSASLHPQSTNDQIWATFMSGGLMRPEGIPATWIKKIEFPQLLRVDQSTEAQFKRLGPDCHLFAAAIYQNHTLRPARDVAISSTYWHEKMALSQGAPFSSQQVDKLLALPALAEKAHRLHNMLMQYGYVSGVGKEIYGLQFAELDPATANLSD